MQQDYLVDVIMTWIQKEMENELKFPETLRSHRSYTYDAYGKVKEIKDHRNLLNNSDQAV